MTDLDQYSSDELLQELHRRETERVQRKVIKRWCDDCKHFKFWKARSEPPDDHNCCQKKHTMAFRMPADDGNPHPAPNTWGFYRVNCWDFSKRSEEQGPPIPTPPTDEEVRADAARLARMRRGGKPFSPRTITPQAPDPKGG